MPDKPRHGEVEMGTIGEAVAAPQTTDQHSTLATLAEIATPVENQDIEQRNALRSESHASTLEIRRVTDCPHETLTLEQARRGRSSYSAYLDRKRDMNAAKTNLAEEPETTGSDAREPSH